MNILFASSEIYPLIKTGGLGDVAAGLSAALHALGQDVTLIMPAYSGALAVVGAVQQVASLPIAGCGHQRTARLLQAQMPVGLAPIGCSLLLVAIDDLFDRSGNPYQNAEGTDWADNGERYGLFAQVVADVAMDRCNLHWRADIVHSNDWQTGLVPALLSLERRSHRPKTIFTIHNLSYGGHFPRTLFDGLNLPQEWWHFSRLEFYDSMSMLKAGIVFADYVTTVSPSYAAEICTPEFGFGLHDALQLRKAQGRLRGILNGIDSQVWNPQTDPFLPFNYSVARGRVAQKKRIKQVLLNRLGAKDDPALLVAPLIGFVGRMVEQKGVDLMVAVIPHLVQNTSACFVIVGSGIAQFEHQFSALAATFPQRVFVSIGYAEDLAHVVEGGADMFLMPSRFEPCGLNQLYSLRYGTPPIVHATGGLRDTVVDANKETLANATATGFVCQHLDVASLTQTIERALAVYQRPRAWQQLQKTGMEQDFAWQRSAQTYLELYHAAIPQGGHYADAHAG
jgi:starch synthase